MHLKEKLKILLSLTLFILPGIFTQENASRNVPSSLLECYNTTEMLDKDNRLPHNLPSLIAIIRKIENTPGLNMDLRTLSLALLHRFRQDGIERNPSVQIQNGIVPFSPTGMSFSRHAAALRLLPGSAVSFPNGSLTATERCTLHYMLSSSFEMLQRGNENTVCSQISQLAQYRVERNVEEENITAESENIKDDVETLTPQELELMKQNSPGIEPKPSTVDPNWMYPALPPNHPDSARISVTYAQSSCPVENGVIKTRWGAVAVGPVLAGIAAALQPQIVNLSDLLSVDLQERGYSSGSALNNRWIATLAGDIAEAALIQGPTSSSISIGAIGGFNSSALPRWYFVTSNENLEMTTAEIRGDLDGLILADSVARWYSSVPTLRLSQILDMYYSPRGVFNTTMRSCNRRTLSTIVAPSATIIDQAYSAALLLHEEVARVTISTELLRTFATQATNALNTYMASSMNNDLECTATDAGNSPVRASTDLTIILDTSWPFATIQAFLTSLLEGIEVGMFNSNFTLINAYDGSFMINSTNTLLDFYNFNATQYANFTSGIDLPRVFGTLRNLQTERLNNEQRRSIGGGNSDVVLVLTYMSTISNSDRDYCIEQLRIMREEVPDAKFLYLTYGSRDRWSDLAVNSATDTFSITTTSVIDTETPITPVVSRIKEIPKRLINSACGASFSASGSPASFTDYVEPSGINYYRLPPNYFSTNAAVVRIQGAGWGNLNVCSSRTVSLPNSSHTNDVSCTTVTTNTHSISFSCTNENVINSCEPLYISVAANSSDSANYQCTDASLCRFPDMRRYTISYENLICRSSGSAPFIAPFLLILSSIFHILHYL